jgi:hypothetical protein
MRATRQIAALTSLTAICFLMLGCPRLAHLAIYNNSGYELQVIASGKIEGALPSGAAVTLRFAGDTVDLVSVAKRWTYIREIPHGGEDGPYFDGVLRVQVEPDGRMFALKRGQIPPLSHFDEQPPGFPLIPKEPNKQPQHNAGIGPATLDGASPPRPALSSEKAARPQSPRG